MVTHPLLLRHSHLKGRLWETQHPSLATFFKKYIFADFRERKGERENSMMRENHRSVASWHIPTRDRAHNWGTRPDWESNLNLWLMGRHSATATPSGSLTTFPPVTKGALFPTKWLLSRQVG